MVAAMEAAMEAMTVAEEAREVEKRVVEPSEVPTAAPESTGGESTRDGSVKSQGHAMLRMLDGPAT